MSSPSTETDTRHAVGVEVKDLNKSYGTQSVLKDVSFNVEPGEVFVLMGPSGSGKSVLLKQIIGLEKPDSGRVLLNGLDSADSETHRKIVTGIVFQAGALFNSMSVFDNLALYPREHRLHPESEIQDRVNETLRMLSIESAAKKIPAELSGGMRKRVAIARSLMMEPQLLLYDEPTSELDPTTGAMISEIIATLKENYAVTSIVVSHDRDLARGIADRMALMLEGRIHAIDEAEKLFASEDEAVVEFLNPRIDIENPRFKRA